MKRLPPSLFTAARGFDPYPEEPRGTRNGFAVQCRDSSTRLVPFHFHETEASVFAREDVVGQVDGAHGSKFAKEFSDVNFLGLGWQVTYENFEHGRIPWRIGVRFYTKKMTRPGTDSQAGSTLRMQLGIRLPIRV